MKSFPELWVAKTGSRVSSLQTTTYTSGVSPGIEIGSCI